MAIECFDELEKLMGSNDQNDMGAAVLESSLLCNAIILYSRATKTNSDERITFDLRPKFSDAETIVHQELIDLRDKAIAHFGSGGAYKGLWHNELMILQSTDDGRRPGVLTRRQMRDRKLARRARVQVERAQQLIREISLQKIDELSIELNAMNPDEAAPEIEKHVINLVDTLQSEDAARTVKESASGGSYNKGIIKH